MKAFEIIWKGLPDCRRIYAAPSAGKAKYYCASGLVGAGYAKTERDAFTQITCLRRPELDAWASQFDRVSARSPEFVCSDLRVNRP